MTTRTTRIAKIKKRIAVADQMIERWQHVAHYSTQKRTRKMAERRVEKFEERRDLWEERLVSAELA
jgi:hypothetical protein